MPAEVRLAVRAAGVNPIDRKIPHGFMRRVMPVDLPGGLGSDVAGAVDQVGEGVTWTRSILSGTGGPAPRRAAGVSVAAVALRVG